MRKETGHPFVSLDCGIMGTEVRYFESLPSTNQKAMELASAGAPEGTVVVAREQTAGKGRLGRTWISPPGGLYLSIILRPDLPQEEVTVLPLLAGLAVSKAISTSCGILSSLKWPNDVLIGGRKVCGILSESSYSGERLNHVVIGIGIDVNNDLSMLPQDIRSGVTTLKEETGGDVDVGIVYRDLMYILEIQYGRLFEVGAAAVLDDWTARSSTIGKDVRVVTGQGSIEGKALGVDGTGALIIKQGSRMTRVDNGDVVHLR